MFKLSRYFSIASAVAIALITAIFAFAYATSEKARVIALEEANNASLARALANSILIEHGSYLRSVGHLDGAALRAQPETARLDVVLRQSLAGLNVHKVKIYHPNGLTIYSSDPNQIGESKRGVPSFEISVHQVRPLSQLSYRGAFSAYSGIRTNLDLVETYVPFANAAGQAEIIFELYTDVTAKIASMKNRIVQFTGLFLLAFAILYSMLLLVVRHADRILKRQYAELATFNSTLEARVEERTKAAEQASESERKVNIQLKREIEERKRVEQQLITQREGLMKQQAILGKLIRHRRLADPDWAGSIQMLMEAASLSLGTERASTWLFNQDRNAIDCIDLFIASSNEHASGVMLKAVDFPRYFSALETDDHIAAADAHRDPRTSEFSAAYLTPLGITSMLDVPIMREGRVAGVVCIEHVGASICWRPEQQVFATAIASLVSLVLEGRDRLQIEEELRRSNIELEAATRAKTEFLATMSHEIRTPMNGVLGTIDLLLDTRLADDQQRLALTARNSAEGLLGILNDILDYSKLEAGKAMLEIVDFNPEQVLDDVVSLLGSEASQKSITLKMASASEVAMWVSGDPIRLRQVCFNLIANAIKFTEHGQVEVKYGWQHLENNRILARFEVIDTGIGIPDESIALLFTRFTQVDASITRRFGGTGLGLAITKQLVELMGGRIGVTSKEGEGSTFWFEVPWNIGTPVPQLAAGNADELVAAVRRLRVLVADDNSVNRMIVEMLLGRHGHIVRAVANGREAVEALQLTEYDLVLMDVQMPEMDGTTATRIIRQLGEPLHRIPIIALTAHAMPGHRVEYLAAGMDDYVAKPLRAPELLAAMSRVMAKNDAATTATSSSDAEPQVRGHAEPAPAEVGHCTSNGGNALADLPVIDRMVLGGWSEELDPAAVRLLLDEVPDEAGQCLSEVRKAISAGDLTQAKRIAHRLKGMAGNLGATRLAEAARNLEIDTPAAEAAMTKLEDLERTVNETITELRLIA